MITPKPSKKREITRETLSDIHHQASEIQRQIVQMLENDRVGAEWRLRIKHAHERIGLLLERI